MNETQVVDRGPKIPRQIVAQHARALELLEAQNAPPTETPPADPPATASPVVSAPLAASEFTPEMLLKAPDEARDNDPKYWKARCNIVEGHRRDHLRTKDSQIAALQLEIEQLQAKNAELVRSHPAAQPAIDLTKHFSAEELERIGEDNALTIVRSAQRIADETVAARIAAEVKPILEREEKQKASTKAERQRAFFQVLDEGMPEWRAVNQDARWRVYLDGRDSTSGLSRQKILDQFQAAGDAEGVLTMLRTFMQSLQPVRVPAEPPVTASAAPGTAQESPRAPPGAVGDMSSVPMSEPEMRAGFKAKKLGKMTAQEAAVFDARVQATMARRGST